MGNFYVNYTIRSTDQSKAIKALSGRNAFVTSPKEGALVVFDEASDTQDKAIILDLGTMLSQSLGASVLAVLNHDDDVLWYGLFEKGECTDEYDSSPGYFDQDGEPQAPSGGNAEKLCAAFGSHSVDETQRILAKSSYDDDGCLFAFERHRDLVKVLKLPDSAVGFGYAYIAQGEIPRGLVDSDLARV